MIIIIDFGSQTAHLIGRRLKEIGAHAKIVNPEKALDIIKKERPSGIVLSGGPSSVYSKGAPTIDPNIFNLGIPILGICYGLQLTAHLLGGRVISGSKEYGPVKLKIKSENAESILSGFEIIKNLPRKFLVWMSHGDEVIKMPEGFEAIGSTDHMP